MIGYCTNVHAGVTLDAVRATLERESGAVRAALGIDVLPIGLWLAAPAAAELAGDELACRAFRDWLDERGLRVFTFNGFPYGDFHERVVKHQVYLPAWDDPARAAYTLDLASIATMLADPGTTISISTVPLGWRGRVDDAIAATHLRDVARALAAQRETTDVHVRVDLEPEPGCALDRAADVVAFFGGPLAAAAPHDDAVAAHLGVCHDICHSAVMFEPQADAIAQYRAADITIGKVQVSSALECAVRTAADAEPLRAFAEDRYLHQTCVRAADSRVTFHDDLPAALVDAATGTWRTHFHVPIFTADAAGVGTTRREIEACCRAIGDAEMTWEIETYAWTVLPDDARPTSLAASIAEEIAWFTARMPTWVT